MLSNELLPLMRRADQFGRQPLGNAGSYGYVSATDTTNVTAVTAVKRPAVYHTVSHLDQT